MPVDKPLHKACHNGDLAAVRSAIESGETDVNEPGAGDRRPLHRAAGSNHADICTFLIAHGAVVDQQDKSGRTPLHWASISGHHEVVLLLLNAGADKAAVTNTQMTALHGACEAGRAEVVRVLIESCGEDEEKTMEMFNAKDKAGKTPFDLALAGEQRAVIKLLKDKGDPNAASAACVIS